ncbi:hypothetical protein MRX96_020168 [Rhipicephalus microplus]
MYVPVNRSVPDTLLLSAQRGAVWNRTVADDDVFARRPWRRDGSGREGAFLDDRQSMRYCQTPKEVRSSAGTIGPPVQLVPHCCSSGPISRAGHNKQVDMLLGATSFPMRKCLLCDRTVLSLRSAKPAGPATTQVALWAYSTHCKAVFTADVLYLFLALSATSAEIDIIEIRPTLWKRRRDHLSAHSDELSEMDSVDPRTYFGLPEKMTDDASAAFDLGEVKFL